MTKKFDLLVYIGRFQPPHKAHVQTIERALELSEKVVVVLGSDNQPRSLKNPWLWYERAKMLKLAMSSPDSIHISHIPDTPSNNQTWANDTRHAVSIHHNQRSNVGIIGHKKDESSFYLDLFPEWELVEMPNIDGLNASDIREEYFGLSKTGKEISSILHPEVYNYLMKFRDTKEFEKLWEEIYNDKPNSKYG